MSPAREVYVQQIKGGVLDMSDQVCIEVTDKLKANGAAVCKAESQKQTPDSMETCQTVPVDSFSDEYEEETPWGRLFPVGSSFNALGIRQISALHTYTLYADQSSKCACGVYAVSQ